MRHTLIILTIFFSILSDVTFALEKNGIAYTRKKSNSKLKRTVVKLTDLISDSAVEGKYFKVVAGTSDTPVRFDDPYLAVKATHAYYHANLARHFFINTFPPEYVQSLKPIIIRLEITNFFDDASHFIRIPGQEDFNNALSIPASTASKSPKEKNWDNEIWFRPAKTIELDNSVYLTSDALTDPQIRAMFYESIAMSTASQMIRELSSVFWQFSQVDYIGHLATAAISLGVMEIMPRVVKAVSKNIKRKVYMDAVMFPEIIYHEFAHVAFSNHLPLNQYNAVVEGYANYFAGLMTNYHKIMYKGGKFVKGLSGKNAKRFQDYAPMLEAPAMAQSSFTFKLLNDLRMKLGESTFHQILLQASTKASLTDSIQVGLINAIFESVDDLNLPDKTATKFLIHSVMRDLGL